VPLANCFNSAGLFDRREKLAGHWYGYRFDAHDLFELVGRHGGFRRLRAGREQERDG
jgi:hypothetical protein